MIIKTGIKMTAKEKAEQLVDEFENIEVKVLQEYIPKHYEVAKSCAHVVCDETIKLANLMDGGFSFEKEIQFWQDVKREIDAL